MPSRATSSERIEHHQNSTLCLTTRHAGVRASADVMLNTSLLTSDGTALRPVPCACLARCKSRPAQAWWAPVGSGQYLSGSSTAALRTQRLLLRPVRCRTGDVEALRRPQNCERAIGRALVSLVKQVCLRAVGRFRDATESEECEEGYRRIFIALEVHEPWAWHAGQRCPSRGCSGDEGAARPRQLVKRPSCHSEADMNHKLLAAGCPSALPGYARECRDSARLGL